MKHLYLKNRLSQFDFNYSHSRKSSLYKKYIRFEKICNKHICQFVLHRHIIHDNLNLISFKIIFLMMLKGYLLNLRGSSSMYNSHKYSYQISLSLSNMFFVICCYSFNGFYRMQSLHQSASIWRWGLWRKCRLNVNREFVDSHAMTQACRRNYLRASKNIFHKPRSRFVFILKFKI